MSNDEQAKFWNGRMGTSWVSVEDHIDQMLAPISSAAIARANTADGERVIDIGCGCGTTSMQLAASGAAVWGVDISSTMIDRAKQKDTGDVKVAFSVLDAATADYTPDHDCAFSRFGVMFFDDPKNAFTNIRSSLKPGGRLVFLCWQTPQDNPWMSIAGQAVAPFMPENAPRPGPTDPGPFAFADTEYTRGILASAGFSNIGFDSIKRSILMGDDLDELMEFQKHIGPLAGILENADEQTATKATEAVRAAFARNAGDESLALAGAAWLVTAENA